MDTRTLNRKKRQFKALDLIGVSDIAKMAGCPNSKVTIYVQRGILPEPIGEVSGRPVWMKAQVEPYIKALEPAQ